MKATPLSFVELFQGKGLLDFSSSSTSTSSSSLLDNFNWNIDQKSSSITKGGGCVFYVSSDLTAAAIETNTSPSPAAASSSTLSSSLNSGGGGGGGGGSTATTQKPLEEWGTALPESAGPASPGQEQSILRLIMGAIEDPSVGLGNMEFGGGFGLADHQIQGLSFETATPGGGNLQDLPLGGNNRQVNPFSLFLDSASSGVNVMSFLPPPNECFSDKAQPFHPQMIMNPNQTQFLQNPSFFVPLGFNPVQDRPLSLASPQPPQKRINLGTNLASAQQQAIIDQLYKAVELIDSGNAILAQEILARLNHQLSPIGKPFYKAAFYFKEALQSLLLHTNPSIPFSPFSVIYKIGAYKSFCEISPVVQFANFTSNQAFLEAFEGCNRVHILSFDVGFGGEWASLMQELALRSGGPPSLKITAFASPSANDEIELGLTEENLKHFAWELNIGFEFEVVNINCFNSASPHLPINGEAVAVNLPIGAFANYPSYLPRALRFLKQLSPKIVVALDRGCDRIDAPFPNHMIHALQSYSNLLESLESVNANLDAVHKIERYLIQPGIEKIVSGRHGSPEKMLAWRSLFMSSGFSPLTFSNFNESQAECLVQRNLVRGFHVEKRQSSLALCWNRKELMSASAWRAELRFEGAS